MPFEDALTNRVNGCKFVCPVDRGAHRQPLILFTNRDVTTTANELFGSAVNALKPVPTVLCRSTPPTSLAAR